LKANVSLLQISSKATLDLQLQKTPSFLATESVTFVCLWMQAGCTRRLVSSNTMCYCGLMSLCVCCVYRLWSSSHCDTVGRPTGTRSLEAQTGLIRSYNIA